MELNEAQRTYIAGLFRKRYSYMLIFAKTALKNDSLAEEAVQETFRIACVKVDQLISSQNPQKWLITVLSNVIQNMCRQRAAASRLIAKLTLVLGNGQHNRRDELHPNVLYSDLQNDKNYLLLKKLVLDQYSMLELAEELGITLEACRKRVQRAKKALNAIVKDYL